MPNHVFPNRTPLDTSKIFPLCLFCILPVCRNGNYGYKNSTLFPYDRLYKHGDIKRYPGIEGKKNRKFNKQGLKHKGISKGKNQDRNYQVMIKTAGNTDTGCSKTREVGGTEAKKGIWSGRYDLTLMSNLCLSMWRGQITPADTLKA